MALNDQVCEKYLHIYIVRRKKKRKKKYIPTIAVKQCITYINKRPSVGPFIAGSIRVLVKKLHIESIKLHSMNYLTMVQAKLDEHNSTRTVQEGKKINSNRFLIHARLKLEHNQKFCKSNSDAFQQLYAGNSEHLFHKLVLSQYCKRNTA